ncbi:MAG: MFS transporter [Deltaproteobacteria bacterium]
MHRKPHHKWVIFLFASLLFVLSQFYRATIAVITPQLIDDLALSTRQVSLMSAAFFYAFAAMQIPLAVYLDTLGAKKVMIVLNSVAIAGVVTFALKLIATWFSPRRFATLAAVVFSMGTAGNIMATTPLVYLVEWIGWRFSFLLVGVLNFILIMVFVRVVDDTPEPPSPQEAPRKGLSKTLAGITELLSIKDYWIISLGSFCRYGIFAAIQGLYAGPYLMFVMDLKPVTVGNIILSMNIGIICGGPLFGWISDRLIHSRKWVIIPGLTGFGTMVWVLATLSPGAGIVSLAALFFMVGFFSSSGGIMYPHIKERMPPEKSGMAMTGINFFTMIGPAVFLQGLGVVMQTLHSENAWSADAFQHAFLICGSCLMGVALLYVFTSGKRSLSWERYND